MVTIFDILTVFLDKIQPARTVENCTIRRWCETNKNSLRHMSPIAAAILEKKHVKDLYELPDWIPMQHCYYACQMLKDFEEPRKSLYQIMAIQAIVNSNDPKAARLINVMVQRENLTEEQILSPEAAQYASNIVGRAGLIGLVPSSMRLKYKNLAEAGQAANVPPGRARRTLGDV